MIILPAHHGTTGNTKSTGQVGLRPRNFTQNSRNHWLRDGLQRKSGSRSTRDTGAVIEASPRQYYLGQRRGWGAQNQRPIASSLSGPQFTGRILLRPHGEALGAIFGGDGISSKVKPLWLLHVHDASN
ncbi:MAG: hypothetical protein P8O70_21890 [SAR324 cluster bacterium]|nr:hypothetical protein [SAR324 cluster bacterium]